MREIENIALYEADRTTLAAAEAGDLFENLQVERTVGEPEEATLFPKATYLPGLWSWKQRRVVNVRYADGFVERFRIERRRLDYTSEQAPQLTLLPLYLDLGGYILERTSAHTGERVKTVTFPGVTFREALQSVVHGGLGTPDWFRLEYVEDTLASEVVDLRLENSTVLAAITHLAKQVGAEWTARWQGDEAAGYYSLIFVEHLGDPTSGGRYFSSELPVVNRMELERQEDHANYFSGLSAVGGEQGGNTTLLGQAMWDVLSSGSTLQLERWAVPLEGFGVGLYIGNEEQGFQEVTGSRPAALSGSGNDEVDVAGGGGFSGEVRWAEDAGGTPLTIMEDPGATEELGYKVRSARFPDVVPYINLLEEAGVSADMSLWEEYTPPPASVASVDFTYVTDGLTVDFTSEVDVTSGTVDSYHWDFGDDEEGTGANPSHTYAEGGSYTVTLTVTMTDGRTFTATKTLAVDAVQNPPSASFSFVVDELTVTFTDQSTDPDGTIVKWQWAFGDGNTSTDQHPVHTYSSAGPYLVTLRVTDDDGNIAHVERTVRPEHEEATATIQWVTTSEAWGTLYGRIEARETSDTGQRLYIMEEETTPGVDDNPRMIDSFIGSRDLNRAYMRPREGEPQDTYNLWIEDAQGRVVSSVIQLTVDPIEGNLSV